MKRIIFTNPTAQKIYDDYFKRVSRCINILSATDQQDVLMELNSHVYEATRAATPQNELDILVDALDKLGMPEEVLQPIVAAKKKRQAGRTFNPWHIFQALVLNIGNGFGYVALSLIYLFIFAFGALVLMKIIFPSHTGLFIIDGHFVQFGYNAHVPPNTIELLGNQFIPVAISLTIGAYFLNTLLFRWLKRG